MDDFVLARALHVASIVMWIGGVGFVTTTLMPAIARDHPPAARLAAFHRLERRFAWQARLWVVLAGASGFWMLHTANLWDRFVGLQFWWMHAMVCLWLVFFLMLFVIEPVFLHRRMAESPTPARDFARLQRVHWLLLGLAIFTVLGAVAGSHGLL